MHFLMRALSRAGNGGSSSKIMNLGYFKLTPISPNCAREMSSASSSVIQQFALENKMLNRSTVIPSFLTNTISKRYISTEAQAIEDSEGETTIPSQDTDPAKRIKFKRLDKTAKQIMSILDKEAVEKVRTEREIPDIQPGCIVELKVEVPENKRRLSTVKGIVIARRNAGLNSTFRLRRLVAGVGVESVFPLYSPNIKDVKIVDRKKVRRAKLYYLRDRMNALKK